MPILCITYISEGKICGKMAGMNLVASGCHPCRHHQTGFASGGMNCFLTGVENQGRQFKILRKKSLPRRTEEWRRFCKVCKCGPPFSARVVRHDEKDFRPSVAGMSKNGNGLGSLSREFPFLHFVQSLHKGRKHFRQNRGHESGRAWSLPAPTSANLGLHPATLKLCGKRSNRPRKPDKLTDWQRRNFAFCAFGTQLTDQHGIRCGQMADEMKTEDCSEYEQSRF